MSVAPGVPPPPGGRAGPRTPIAHPAGGARVSAQPGGGVRSVVRRGTEDALADAAGRAVARAWPQGACPLTKHMSRKKNSVP
jgi:hypothetical protein